MSDKPKFAWLDFLSSLSRKSKWCMAAISVIVVLVMAFDAFAPGYCSIARAILFLPVSAILLVLVGCMFGAKPLSLNPNPWPYVGVALVATRVLSDLRVGGVYRFLDTTFAMGLTLVVLSIPWKRIFRRGAEE